MSVNAVLFIAAPDNNTLN